MYIWVSIHTPTWGVTLRPLLGIPIYWFQSTHLHEVWPTPGTYIPSRLCFNPHTYMRCDSRQSNHVAITPCFNPHTYMRCDSLWLILPLSHFRFNPHTYMRCDVDYILDLYGGGVSIHTPTWGVTLRCVPAMMSGRFQSTHLHEVWPPLSNLASAPSGFNPHTYMRCDLSTSTGSKAKSSFNPHTYMRCDSRVIRKTIKLWVSIHTPTWGVTERKTRIVSPNKSFNPHTYMRCDFHRANVPPLYRVSIHTPTWGVTINIHTFTLYSWVSIHTPTWGVTADSNKSRIFATSFQSTHLHEVWHFAYALSKPWKSFNPHTYMRCDAVGTPWHVTR